MNDEEYRIQPDDGVRTGKMGMWIETAGPFVDLILHTGEAYIHMPMAPGLARKISRELVRCAREAEANDRE